MARPSTLLVHKVHLKNPFRVRRLPLIVRLFEMAYHTYRKRWTKRLFKRPARLLFEAAYHGLKMGGEGTFAYTRAGETRDLRFNGRNGQFGGIYSFPPEHVFEAPIAALQQVLLHGDRVFFDIGANWGCMSFLAAAVDGFEGRIHAFEPIPGSFDDMQSLVDQAGLRERMTCHRVAVSNETRDGRMELPDGVQSGWAKVSDTGAISVELKRLDDMDLPDPDFIKIDVEDHELAALQGAEALLKRAKPYLIFESWFEPGREDEVLAPWRFLQDQGYRFFCPGWRAGIQGDAMATTNMPPDGALEADLCLLPMEPAHRCLGPQHWSFFACHEDRLGELAGIFNASPH